jgi:hypothetical protein
MKTDRLVRKTHFKKLNESSFSETIMYDLTEDPLNKEDREAFCLKGLRPKEEKSTEQLLLLPYDFSEEKEVLHWAAAVIYNSPTAKRLWEDAAQNDWSVSLINLGSDGFFIDVPSKTIFLDHFSLSAEALGRSTYFRNALLSIFIRALRDVWHENRVGAFEDSFSPEDVLLLERVRAADSDTITILSVWELRGAGFSEVWRHILGSEEGDMAMIFTRTLERQPTALFDGSVLVKTFYQWFEDEDRVNGIDHETLEALDDLLLASGPQNPFGKETLFANFIEALSDLPDGGCYLKALGHAIKEDPFFVGLGDPINQTHLFHIMYDLETFVVNNVPFRDRALARKVFPDGEILSQ